MPALTNPRHEEFAQLVGNDIAPGAAYSQVYGCKAKTGREKGCRLKKDVNVTARIAEIRQGFRQHLDRFEPGVARKYLTRERSLELLAMIAETPIGQIDEKSPLCQAIEYRTTPGNREREGFETIKVKMPSKIQAIELSARILGYLEEKGTTVNVSNVHMTLTPERQAELQRRKRASIERRLRLGAGQTSRETP